MKIALVIERMDTSRGGRETSIAQMASMLRLRKHDVTILCQRGSWRQEGVEVCRLGSKGRIRIHRLRHFVTDVQKAIRERDFDIVHTTLPIPGTNVYQPRGGTIPAQAEVSLRRRKTVVRLSRKITQPLNLCRQEMAHMERQLVADEKALCLPVSQMVADEFRKYYNRSQGVRVVYNAVDVPDVDSDQRAAWRHDVRTGIGAEDDSIVLLTLATNFDLKGVPEAITAFGQWYHGRRGQINARLVVVGQKRFKKYLRLADKCDVSDRVIFVPPTDNAFRWYAGADICVLLSWYDPCSRVVLEAMRWGIPSITTACNGAAEAIADGCGIVVPSPRDISAVVDAMNKLSDPANRSACEEACRKKAPFLSIERHVDELLDAYSEAPKLK